MRRPARDAVNGGFVLDGMRARLAGSSVGRALLMLPGRPRRKLLLLIWVQVFLGSLDLAAVALVGVLGTLAVSGVQSRPLGETGTIATAVRWLHIDGLQAQQQVAFLALLTTIVFLGRTAASIYLTRRALHFLGVRTAEASADLIDRLLRQPLTFLQTRSMQDFIYAVTASANSLVLGVLGTIVVMTADGAMLLAMAVLLLFVSPVVAVAAGVLLGVLVLALHHLTTGRAQRIGSEAARLDVESRELLVESLSTYRDMQVRGSRGHYAEAFRDSRMRAAYVAAEWAFMPNISKYVLEAAVILGALLMGALEFAIEDAQKAVGVLAVFLAAGMRLAPAIIRLQQGAIALRGNLGQGALALRLGDELAGTEADEFTQARFVTEHEGFSPTLTLVEVSYTYPSAERPAVAGLSLHVEPGQMLALVGPSGAGKSTAADLILGVLEPDEGQVELAGLAPDAAESRWPGAVGYVPQDVWIADGSVRRNVALGFPEGAVADEAIWAALDAARLGDVIRALPDGLDAAVGERGAKLSGGQRQRLGIARALLTRPKLLVLDEATSALDAETEHQVAAAMQGLRGSVTVVVIAHRLAVVRDADIVAYFDEGAVRAIGDFEFVRSSVPDFDRQAQLLGL